MKSQKSYITKIEHNKREMKRAGLPKKEPSKLQQNFKRKISVYMYMNMYIEKFNLNKMTRKQI